MELENKAESLILEAQKALEAKYYAEAYRLFQEALGIYRQLNQPEKADQYHQEAEKIKKESVSFAPLPAIDHHAHPFFVSEIKKNPSLYMAARHFRLKMESVPQNIDDLIKHMDEANIEKAIIMTLDTSASDHWAFKVKAFTNDDIARMVQQYPDRLIGYGSVDPRRPDAVEETERCVKELKFKGMKFHPAAVGLFPNDEKYFYPIYEKCVELGIPVQSHSGTTGLYFTKIKHTMPIYYDDVAVDFPTLKLVLLHFGIGGWHEQAMSVAFRHPNVYLDLSGASPRIIPQDLIQAANTPFYQNKILFGTDYPFVGMAQWFNTFNKIMPDVWTKETKKKVFRENALSLHANPPFSAFEILKSEGMELPPGVRR